MPSQSKRNTAAINLPQALTSNNLRILTEVINPNHLMNPWPEEVRFRNGMVIVMLIVLGISTNELLNLRIQDIDFEQRKVIFRRNRKNAPSLLLLMPEYLAAIMHEYIAIDRQKYPGSKEHDFVVVSCKDGHPLSPSSFKHIFTALSRKVPGLSTNFSARTFRHTAALQGYGRNAF